MKIVSLVLLPLLSIAFFKLFILLEDHNLLDIFGKNEYSIINKQNITEIIGSWPGFTAEDHYITTEDGYKLLVERSYSKITQRNPIIIVHGMGMNSLGWVNRGNVSLAWLLGSLGYDVWMLNFRGSWYSKHHVNLTTSDREYWKYNINELGIHDVRETVKLVANKTKLPAIYIGYSMGSTSFFIYSSTFPKESKQHVKAMIALAPVINYKNVRSIVRYTSGVWPSLKSFIYHFWNGEILPGYSVLLRPLVRFSGGIYIIQFVCNLIFGDNFQQMDISMYPNFVTQSLDTIAVETYSHYIQFYQSSEFKNFDYGKIKNFKIYGKPTPPHYDLSKIPVPMAVFAGENDWLATLTNAKELYSKIKPSIRCGFQIVPFMKWNHIDFLIAKDLPKYFYKYLFQKIDQLGNNICVS